MSDPLMATSKTDPTQDPLQRAVNRQADLQTQIRSGNLLQDIKSKATDLNTPKSFVLGANG